MSILIDELIFEKQHGPFYDDCKGNEQVKHHLVKNYPQNYIDGKWYIAKHLPFYSIGAFIGRIKDAYRVLTDKSRAYHYKEDE